MNPSAGRLAGQQKWSVARQLQNRPRLMRQGPAMRRRIATGPAGQDFWQERFNRMGFHLLLTTFPKALFTLLADFRQ
ncbi:MAG: hypothetical protein Rhims3KO_26340 [Hyphomicrobiales bacterium]